eukprot:jgi/Bigna1/87254/estExt_fgenesh1_pg.C_180095
MEDSKEEPLPNIPPELTREVSDCGICIVCPALYLTDENDGLIRPDTDRFVRLLKWLKKGGSLFPKLYLKYYEEDYREVHTKEAVDENVEVVYVPLAQIMTTDKAKSSTIGQAIRRSGYVMNCSHSWLACYLCQEKHNPKSYWKPFIDILPDKYYNMPIFFNDHYNKHLKGSYAVPLRRIGVGAVPMADMLNHHPTRQTTWGYSDKKQGFVMTTTQKVGSDQQLFDSYGRKWQGRYFVNYGFTIDQNYEDNDAVIYARLEDSDPLYHQKRRQLGSWTVREFQPQAHWARKAKDMMAFFRTAAATSEELARRPNFNHHISIRNESAALALLDKACDVSLGRFEHSLQHDHKLLKQNKWEDTNHRNCIIMRAGEKEVLMWYKNLSRVGRKLLTVPLKNQEAEAPAKELRLRVYYDAHIFPLVKAASRRC